MGTDAPEDLISPKRAAKLLGISQKTVYRWAATGKLRSYEVKQLVRLSLADVLAEIKPRPADVNAAATGRRAANARRKRTRDVLEKAGLI